MDLTAELRRRRVEVEPTHLDRVYFPEAGYTKADLLAYYLAAADAVLAHLRDRPLSFHRFPEGIGGAAFFQRDVSDAPAGVRAVRIWAESSHRNLEVAVGGDLTTLVWAANGGAIEMHPWYSRVVTDAGASATLTFTGSDANLDRSVLNYPDVVVFDLDPPGGGAYDPDAFQAAADAARLVRDALADLQLESYVKTSGKSGLHVYVPIRRQHPYEATRTFAQWLAKELATQYPTQLTVAWAVEKRGDRVFLDVNQNVRGKTLAGPYSARPTPQATVSTPLTWDEVEERVDPQQFTIETVPARLRARGDLWKDMLRRRQVLPEDPGADDDDEDE